MRTTAEEQAFLHDVIAVPSMGNATVPATTSHPHETERSTPRARSKTVTTPLYNRILETVAYSGSLLIAGGLWFVGAFFTLTFLRGSGVPIDQVGYAQWAIPAIITAVELCLWPKRGRKWQRATMWLIVLAFDVGTSWAGLIAWGAGRHINLFNGFTLPSQGTALAGFALAMGLILAFIPERFAQWAVSELRAVWKV